MKNNIKYVIIFLIIIVILGIGFYFLFFKKGDKENLKEKAKESSFILKLPDKLDLGIFSDKRFLELETYGPKNVEDIKSIGRENPFAPY